MRTLVNCLLAAYNRQLGDKVVSFDRNASKGIAKHDLGKGRRQALRLDGHANRTALALLASDENRKKPVVCPALGIAKPCEVGVVAILRRNKVAASSHFNLDRDVCRRTKVSIRVYNLHRDIPHVLAIGQDGRPLGNHDDPRRRTNRLDDLLRPFPAVPVGDGPHLARLIHDVVEAETPQAFLAAAAPLRDAVDEQLNLVARRIHIHRSDLPLSS